MKILRIIARLNVGGPSRHVVWLANGLREEFKTVLVTGRVPSGEEDMAWLAKANGVNPVFIEEMSRELSLKDILALYKLFRLMQRERPDLVCTHTAKAGTVGRSAAFLYRWMTPATLIGRPRRVVVTHTFHGHVFHSYYSPIKTKIFILIEKLLARFATNQIIVISDQQLKEIRDDVGVGRREQYGVIPLGIDLEPFADARTKRDLFRGDLPVPPGDLIVGFVGRLTEIKNLSMYIEVAAKYEHETSSPQLHFAIAGDGHLRQELEDLGHKLKAPNVLFLGNRQDVDVVYAGIDIVALTSLNEGTPLSLIEGMASGRPIISTLVGGVKDLLGNRVEEHNGFVVYERGIGVESEDVDGFLKGLIYLVKNEKLREDLSARGRAFVFANYSKDRMVKDHHELYRKLLDKTE